METVSLACKWASLWKVRTSQYIAAEPAVCDLLIHKQRGVLKRARPFYGDVVSCCQLRYPVAVRLQAGQSWADESEVLCEDGAGEVK